MTLDEEMAEVSLAIAEWGADSIRQTERLRWLSEEYRGVLAGRRDRWAVESFFAELDESVTAAESWIARSGGLLAAAARFGTEDEALGDARRMMGSLAEVVRFWRGVVDRYDTERGA